MKLTTARPRTRRLDAIILQEQLDREMGDRQARYTGICPVREQVYAMAFDELLQLGHAQDDAELDARLGNFTVTDTSSRLRPRIGATNDR